MSDFSDFDVQQFVPFLLNQAAEASSMEFQRLYKARYGMLRTEWRVLFHLGIYGRMTARDICDRARMHKTKISRAVQKLADRRFLTRDPCATDRRAEFLELTPAGQAAYQELLTAAAAYEQRLMAGFTREEAELLRKMLLRLAN